MKKRFADLATKFRVEGLSGVINALRGTATEAKKVGDQVAKASKGDLAKSAKEGEGAFRKAGTVAATALKGITNGTSAAGRGVRAVASAGTKMGSAVARGASTAARSVGQIGVAAGGAAAALAAVAKAGAVGFSIKAITDTVADIRTVRQTASFLGTSLERASFYQNLGRQSGIEPDEMRDILGAFNTAVSEAISDPESGFAEIFKNAGIKVTVPVELNKDDLEVVSKLEEQMKKAGASSAEIRKETAALKKELQAVGGAGRGVTDLFADLAAKTSGMDGRQRSFLLAQIFGDGDALKVSELLDRIGADQAGLMRDLMAQNDAGLLVNQEAVKWARRFDQSIGSLRLAFGSVQRALFVRVAPVVTAFFDRVSRFFIDANTAIADRLFKSLQSIYRLFADIGKVLLGFDLDDWLGMRGQGVQHRWLYDVRDVLVAIRDSAKPLVRVLADVARSGADALRGINVGTVTTGLIGGIKSFAEMLGRTPALIRDLGKAWERLTLAPIDYEPTLLETEFGAMAVRLAGATRRLFLQVLDFLTNGGLQKAFADLIKPLTDAFAESSKALTGEIDVSQLSSTLAVVLYEIQTTIQYVRDLGNAFKKVFIDDLDPSKIDPRFRFLTDIRDGVGSLVSTLAGVSRILTPAFGAVERFLASISTSFAGVNVAAALLVGLLGGRLALTVLNLAKYLLEPVKLIGGAIGKVIGFFTGKSGLTTAATGAGQAAAGALATSAKVVETTASAAATAGSRAVGIVQSATSGMIRSGSAVASAAMSVFLGAFEKIGKAVTDVYQQTGHLAVGFAARLPQAISRITVGLIDKSIGILGSALQTALDLLSGQNGLVERMRSLPGAVSSATSAASTALKGLEDAFTGIVSSIAGEGGIVGALKKIPAAAKTAFAGAISAATGFLATLGAMATPLAVGAAAVGVGGAIGAFAYNSLIADWQRRRNDEALGAHVDGTVRPEMNRIFDLSGGPKPGAIDAYKARQAAMSAAEITAQSVDLAATTVNLPPSNLRPINVHFNGQQVGSAFATESEAARFRRSQAGSLGGV